jgi:hypothetical protein
MSKRTFGSCCEDLSKAMTVPPNSLFRIEENDVLYLTVGFEETPQGTAWFDHAVLFCPFCGSQLQTREEISEAANTGQIN